MKFIISSNSGAAAIGADRVLCHYIDERSTNDPTTIPMYGGKTDWWYKEGINHGINEQNHIVRQLPRYEWVAEIHDLQPLINLILKGCRITIKNFPKYLEDLPTIEVEEY